MDSIVGPINALLQAILGLINFSLPLIILVMASIYRSKSPKASNFMIGGAVLLFGSFLFSIITDVLFSRSMGVNYYPLFSMLSNAVTITTNSAGILLLAIAAVCERSDLGSDNASQPSKQSDGNPNPFRTPSNP